MSRAHDPHGSYDPVKTISAGDNLSRRSGGSHTIIPVVGHPYKTSTSEKWARQAQRRGQGQIVDHVFYALSEGQVLQIVERDIPEIENSQFEARPRACDLVHEHDDHAHGEYGGPVFKTFQFERILRRR
jgi:hypothetical protein